MGGGRPWSVLTVSRSDVDDLTLVVAVAGIPLVVVASVLAKVLCF